MVYDTISLSGTIPDQQGCMGTLWFSFVGMQNGDPDGLALVDPTDEVVEFISYEGSFTANDGPAFGMSSADVGVSESSSTPVGFSLQLSGNGAEAADFTWQSPATDTPGSPNTGQTFDGCGGGCTGPEDCDDGVACTDDTCDTETGICEFTPNDTLCDNGAFCDGTETCDAELGCQSGTAPCTGPLQPHCDEDADQCVECLISDHCDDSEPCNGAEACSGRTCIAGTITDCNTNLWDDACDIAEGTSEDCNGNGVPDECDISGGFSIDLDGNGVPDECQQDVPAVSTWGVCVLVLATLIAGTCTFQRRGLSAA